MHACLDRKPQLRRGSGKAVALPIHPTKLDPVGDHAKNIILFGWLWRWLVLIYCERKALLAGCASGYC